MSAPTAVYLLLAVALAFAFLGVRDLVAGAALSSRLRVRAQSEAGVPMVARLHAQLDARFRSVALGRRIAEQLSTAGVPLRALDFTLACALGGVLVFELARIIVPGWLAGLAAAGAVRAAWMWVNWKRAKRREAFTQQLPELAHALANGAQAGLSVTGALGIAATELDDPARTELGVTLEELRIGQAFDRAMAHMGERMPSREISVLVSTLTIQQRAGGDLVRALSDMSATLEARKDLRREVRTMMAGSMAVAWMTAAIGVGSLVVLNLISPGALKRMTSSALGLILFSAAAVLYSIGFLLIRRVTRVDT